MAAECPLPQTHYYSVEYPGYVRSTSVPTVIRNLGGQSRIDNVFRRSTPKAEVLLELSLRPDSLFSHPVPGDVVGTNNLVLKVTKRRKKASSTQNEVPGEYKAEVVGVIPRTVRFRSMADFQFEPDRTDPIYSLRQSMHQMNVDNIREYVVPVENPDYSRLLVPSNVHPDLLPTQQSDLRLFPPPLFSRQTIPQAYNFRANTASVVTSVIDEETGEEKKRMINRMRWKGYGPAAIMFNDAEIPQGPPPAVASERTAVNQDLLKKLIERFEERPIWTRASLLNQFSLAESRDILNSKPLLPLVCYVFQDGPWRDTLVRFRYDPRKEPEARLYQRLYFRNANHPISRPSVVTRRQDRSSANAQTRNASERADQESERRSHIFDGKTITKETAAFQLCDICDPMLKAMIENPEGIRDTCHERDGWYSNHALERIKTVLRHKFFTGLDGRVATDEECKALLAATEAPGKTATTSRSQKLRAGKHNMAKGALRPEDAAALRLRAALNRNAKSRLSGVDD
ncbi:hypothetical protein AGABI1DRAFT_73813 [Agaricus bisporus var. burnettii JB137-S8]|uniref:Transcription factor IIIC subunit 5 HTH domain-containing protein n=1 Tax=Agaricus bisporus var. burnettii (strain JB137-S8 / ATCC MYA-4627 / FGSC 10392) TaxID=597362 RepID=K5W140_AGABU|nr:uncharacterized protein AGABI1DRAFT_73813 [Agaricus bisporus var. burnettii JB137-S8]EKM80519.1 hypothetical protein AGABI1DRAFT_73813 [Agaricus bisporus var. burnettii JB137-S8]